MLKYFFFIFIFVFNWGLRKCVLQFEITPDRPRCYLDELYKASVLMLKWRITGVNETDKYKCKINKK